MRALGRVIILLCISTINGSRNIACARAAACGDLDKIASASLSTSH
jgi:hypothetical protein